MTTEQAAMAAGTDHSALASLHTRIVDALAGFETMVEKARPSFRPVAESFRNLHRVHADEVREMLLNFGKEPDDDGSIMATVNRTVVSLRSLVDDIDADTLDAVLRGETHVLDAFDEAIDAEDDKARLREMRDELVALIVEVRK
jgi:uncharacterized protein (TIGR02284 family)